jgi:hypothetical protein
MPTANNASLLALYNGLWESGEQGAAKVYHHSQETRGWDGMLIEDFVYLDCSSIEDAQLPPAVERLLVRPVYHELYVKLKRTANAVSKKKGWVAYITGQPGIGMYLYYSA